MNEIIEVDNFAPDAETIRSTVIHGEFSTEKYIDGAQYSGISKLQVPHWYGLIARAIGHPITPKLACFRLNLAGELPHSWVHSDGICARYASVLYLNPEEQCQGGTAFWKHERLNMERMPSDAELRGKDIEVKPFHEMMTRQWKELKAWKQWKFVAMRFNRFITYPTSLFHSRFPFEGFGSGPQDGRLIWICFYDKKGKFA